MAPIPDAQTVFQRWQTGLGNAATKMREGVQAVTTAPGDLAVRSQQALVNNFNAAVTSGLWARRTQAVGLSGWQQPMLSVGIDRAIQGAQSKGTKYQQALTTLLPFESNLQAQIQSMPNASDADREARALAWIRGMRQYKQTY